MGKKESAKPRYTTLNIEGTKYRTLHNTKFKTRTKWEKPNKNKVFSFIPGTIVKIKIEEGKKVKKGQQALIFEAMKMRNRVHIPSNGVVKSVNIKEGELVPKGRLLFEIVPAVKKV